MNTAAVRLHLTFFGSKLLQNLIIFVKKPVLSHHFCQKTYVCGPYRRQNDPNMSQTTDSWITGAILGIYHACILPLLTPKAPPNGDKMGPKGITNGSQNPHRFCVVFLSAFGGVLAPKM